MFRLYLSDSLESNVYRIGCEFHPALSGYMYSFREELRIFKSYATAKARSLAVKLMNQAM
jgi:hypothetical protein